MSSEKTEAIVIRMADFSESSRVVTLFTRDWGKLSALAKGAKRPKSAFEAALDLLAVCNIVFIRKSSGGLDILTEAQLNKRFKPSSRQLNRLYGGYYVAELLAGLTEEYDPHPSLYQEALETLDRLAGEDNFALSVLRFELTVLREIGQLPSFEFCVRCGELVGDATWYGLKVSQGGLICRSCLAGEEYYHRLQGGTVAILKRLSVAEDSTWKRLSATNEQILEMRRLADTAIRQSLGRRPKTLSFLKFS